MGPIFTKQDVSGCLEHKESDRVCKLEENDVHPSIHTGYGDFQTNRFHTGYGELARDVVSWKHHIIIFLHGYCADHVLFSISALKSLYPRICL